MNLQDRIVAIAEELNKHIGNEVLAYLIAESAGVYWEKTQVEDFGLQFFDAENIVFGGTNRLIWSPSKGFRPDRGYCTAKFLKHYDSIGPLPGNRK
jgi:hypothetical protein